MTTNALQVIRKAVYEDKQKIANACKNTGISAERMLTVTMAALEDNPALIKCEPKTITSAVREAARHGWEIGGPLAHCYLVPYGKKATLVPGYRGLIDLVTRRGEVRELIRQVVRKNDAFAYDPLEDKPIQHNFGTGDRGEVTHYYCIARYRDGSLSQPFVMTKAEVETHRDKYSQGYKFAESGDPAKGGSKKDSPWHEEFDKMALKTVCRQFVMGGYVSTSAEVRELVGRESVIEGTVISTVTPEEPHILQIDSQIEQEPEQENDSKVTKEMVLSQLNASETITDVEQTHEDNSGLVDEMWLNQVCEQRVAQLAEQS